MKKMVLLAALVTLSACSDAAGAKETLRKAGFTEVETTGYAWFACSEDDTFHTGFRAKNSQGVVVEGVVCCGLAFKACTVRF